MIIYLILKSKHALFQQFDDENDQEHTHIEDDDDHEHIYIEDDDDEKSTHIEDEDI